MARPITPTPVLKNKDAEIVYREAEKEVRLSAAKKNELKYCLELYKKLSPTKRRLSI